MRMSYWRGIKFSMLAPRRPGAFTSYEYSYELCDEGVLMRPGTALSYGGFVLAHSHQRVLDRVLSVCRACAKF